MKTSSIRFAQLRRLLLDLRFCESRVGDFWRFEHPKSGAIFLFRSYAENENVTVQDIATTRMHLDWRGLLSCKTFDDSLEKTPA